jgi:hypothetical protein
MAKFLTTLALKDADNKDDGRWIVSRPLRYVSDVAERKIVVPKGFRTDLASVPRLPIIFLLCGDTSSEAAVVHDYLYSTQQVRRRMADAVLLEASRITGVPAWRRYMIWAGVRLFGWFHWK